MDNIRNEYGSDFETYISSNKLNTSPYFPEETSLFFSGRAALYALIKQGIALNGWKRIYVPTYYCHEVYTFIDILSIEIIPYPCLPTTLALNNEQFLIEKESVLLVVDYFGINKVSYSNLLGMTVVEDLTHNLASFKLSDADYCFGSLRKVLPMAVGGFVFSPKGLLIPQLIHNDFADYVAYKKTTGMFLKKLYLQKKNITKDLFRDQLIGAEEMFNDHRTIAALPHFVKSEYEQIEIGTLIQRKKDNLAHAKSILQASDKFSLLTSVSNTDYALILKFSDSSIRDEFRKRIIERNIFPMVLWPGQNADNQDFENKILFIHIDYRYNLIDITAMVEELNNAIKNV